VSFSYVGSPVELTSIAPLKNLPLRRTINRLLVDIEAALPACRRSWWLTKRTTCLANQWAVMLTSGRIELSSELAANAKQIADASYDPDRERAAGEFSGRNNSGCEHTAMISQGITDADFAAALAAGRVEAETEIRAHSVRYVADRDAIEIVTNRHAGFLIPRAWIGALQDVPVEDLAKLEIWPDGSAIELEERDIHISVDGLMTAILPAMLPSRTVAAIFASRGGSATSDAKRSSAQANGRKGGRPRKAGKVAVA
jgi:hypothetical protein